MLSWSHSANKIFPVRLNKHLFKFQSSRNPSQGEIGIYIQVIVCLSYRSSVTATGLLIRGTKISSRRPTLYAKPTIGRAPPSTYRSDWHQQTSQAWRKGKNEMFRLTRSRAHTMKRLTVEINRLYYTFEKTHNECSQLKENKQHIVIFWVQNMWHK